MVLRLMQAGSLPVAAEARQCPACSRASCVELPAARAACVCSSERAESQVRARQPHQGARRAPSCQAAAFALSLSVHQSAYS